MKTKTKLRGFKKVMFIIFIVIVSLIVLIAIALSIFAYTNMNYDKKDMKKVWKAGYTEKQATLDSGTVLNYAESPDETKTPLLLIHGQAMAWEDYARVLPDLAKEYHVYAIDCHGHGSSSHDTSSYKCQTMTDDFVWFIENVIGEPCVVSGHSSGGILAANIAATSPENVLGAVLEDPPFFSVIPEEMENTFVWKDGFEVTHNYLSQEDEAYYVPYYFKNGYLWKMFQGLEEFPAETARKYSEEHKTECEKIWYMPYKWTHGLLFTNEYDYAFSETFYNGSWFDGVSQEDILKNIKCPCIYIKAKTEYGEDGVLYAANDEDDAARVVDLTENCERVETETSDHDIHFIYSKKFVEVLTDFNKELNN